jgi:TRAP transporter TAXI family solute receptor
MKKLAICMTAIAMSAAFLAGAAQAETTYRFGGGPSGGAWHPATSAGTQLLNQELKGKFNFLYTPSGGSVANVRSVSLGNYATAWGHIGQIYQSWNGEGLFEKDGANKNFRIVARVRAQSQIFAVLADNPIQSFSDMKGKVVNMLSRGSGSSVNCVNVFTSLGLMDKVEARYLGFAASARALGDRQIDVFCSAGVPFVIPALTQLSVSKPVRYVGLTEEEQKKVTSAYRFYTPITIPPQKDVKGVDKPARSISYDVWWIVHKQMSDEAVYDMLKVIAAPENLARLTKAAAYWKDLSGQFDALVQHKILVHPAAARYWKERGVNVPASIVKGY